MLIYADNEALYLKTFLRNQEIVSFPLSAPPVAVHEASAGRPITGLPREGTLDPYPFNTTGFLVWLVKPNSPRLL